MSIEQVTLKFVLDHPYISIIGLVLFCIAFSIASDFKNAKEIEEVPHNGGKEIIVKGEKFLYKIDIIRTHFYYPDQSIRVISGGGRWSFRKFDRLDINEIYHEKAFTVHMDIESEYKTKKQVQTEISKAYEDFLVAEARKEEIQNQGVLVIK